MATTKIKAETTVIKITLTEEEAEYLLDLTQDYRILAREGSLETHKEKSQATQLRFHIFRILNDLLCPRKPIK